MPNRKKNYADLDKFRKTWNSQKKRYYGKTAKYGRRIWTNEEDQKVLEQFMTDTELSGKIGRSVRAIQIRRSKLKHLSV